MLETPLSDVRQILKVADVEVEELKTLLQPSAADNGYGQGYPSFSPMLVGGCKTAGCSPPPSCNMPSCAAASCCWCC